MSAEQRWVVRCDGFRPPGGECKNTVLATFAQTGADWGEVLCKDCGFRLELAKKNVSSTEMHTIICTGFPRECGKIGWALYDPAPFDRFLCPTCKAREREVEAMVG